MQGGPEKGREDNKYRVYPWFSFYVCGLYSSLVGFVLSPSPLKPATTLFVEICKENE